VANSYIDFSATSNSGINEVVITFKFLNKKDVKVKSINTTTKEILNWTYIEESQWNSNLVNGQTSFLFGNYTIVEENGSNKIKFSTSITTANISGPINYTYSIKMYRRTAIENNTYFSNGSPIQASDLNNILLQSLYNSEEAIEIADSIDSFALQTALDLKVNKTGADMSGNLNFISGGVSGLQTLQLSETGSGAFVPQVFLQGGTIRNVPTPALASDATNKAYVDSLTLSGGSQPVIEDDSITSTLLRKVVGQEAVTSATIRAGAVTNAKLGTNSVTTIKINNFQVTEDKLATGSVTTNKLATGCVTPTAISSSAVESDKIATGAVTADKLATGAVTNDKIVDGTISSSKLSASGLNGTTTITDNSIPASKLKNLNVSWSTTIDDLAINRPSISTTATTINALDASITANNLIQKKTLSLLESNNTNSGSLLLSSGFFKNNPSVSFTAPTLEGFNGTTPVVEVSSEAVNGYYPYKIFIKNPALAGKEYATTLIKWQRRYYTNDALGSQLDGEFNSGYVYKQIANIPFNYVIHNDNPEISLTNVQSAYVDTPSWKASSNIVFNHSNSSSPTKYLITLSGTISCTRTGILAIKSIGDEYHDPSSSSYSPKSVAMFNFDSISINPGRSKYFSIQSVLTISGSQSLTTACQYYYSDDQASAPQITSSAGVGFGYGYTRKNVTTGDFAVPVAWSKSPGSTYANWNDSIVDLKIQRI
jgi:hypothetical protein